MIDDKYVDRFWGKALIGKGDECWEWAGARKGSNGAYGCFTYEGKSQLAHRISALICGLIDGIEFKGYKAEVIMHTCDNPACVNPNHLMVGTQQDNIKDRDKKGRRPAYHGKPLKGEKHAMAKLSAADVRHIRWLGELGLAAKEIASAYGMESSTISKIRQGKLWSSVT